MGTFPNAFFPSGNAATPKGSLPLVETSQRAISQVTASQI